MAEIIIIGVGHSQTQVVKKLHNLIPEAKCINITMGHNFNIPSDEENIINYNLADYSKTAQRIKSLCLMPGSAQMETEKHLKEILDEQLDQIAQLFK